jgi:hypothetical protein
MEGIDIRELVREEVGNLRGEMRREILECAREYSAREQRLKDLLAEIGRMAAEGDQ